MMQPHRQIEHEFTWDENFDSMIVSTEAAKNNLLQCIDNLSATKLVYKGSRDGFLQGDFMDKMRTIPSEYPCSLIIIKTLKKRDKQYVFGGFTDIPWKDEGAEEGVQNRNNSFIFS